MQICLAHSLPCGNMDHNEAQKKAVSQLLFGLKIDNYIALHEYGISSLANVIGDIDVTLNETLDYFENVKDENNNIPFDSFIAGDSLTVTPQNISAFFRIRNCYELGGAQKRLERITDYILKCYNKFTSVNGLTSIIKSLFSKNEPLDDLYNEISSYISTDIENPVKLATKYLARYKLNEENVFYIPHITGQKEEYEVCYMDEKKTKEILLHIFYKEVLF